MVALCLKLKHDENKSKNNTAKKEAKKSNGVDVLLQYPFEARTNVDES